MADANSVSSSLATLGASGWVMTGNAQYTGIGAGRLQLVDVTASRDYNPNTDRGKCLRPSPVGSSFTVTVQVAQVAGDWFAWDKPGAGKITVAVGGGLTLTDTGGKQAAQATGDLPIVGEFQAVSGLILCVG